MVTRIGSIMHGKYTNMSTQQENRETDSARNKILVEKKTLKTSTINTFFLKFFLLVIKAIYIYLPKKHEHASESLL